MRTRPLTPRLRLAATAAFLSVPWVPAPAEPPVEALQAYGWRVAVDAGLDAGLNDAELELVLAGIRRAAGGETARPPGQRTLEVEARDYLAQRRLSSTLSANERLFADLAARGVARTASGLYYEIIEKGTGTRPGDRDEVRVHYHGTLPNGIVFDSTVEAGKPTQFPMLGVVEGFREGLSLLREGGSIRLYVPSQLGYGEIATGKIPAHSALIFEVELLRVVPPSPPRR